MMGVGEGNMAQRQVEVLADIEGEAVFSRFGAGV